jgi:ATP-dependent RNA helicase HelY
VEPLMRLRIPSHFNARSAKSRRDLATVLRDRTSDIDLRAGRRSRSAAADDKALADMRRRMRAHPCHGCSEREDHARWAERHARLRRETQGLERRVENRTNSIAQQFDRVCDVLTTLGYLTSAGDDAQVTEPGQRLARLYSELDLLAAECLRTGAWSGLNEAELAAVCSALVFESRGEEDAVAPRLPGGTTAQVLQETLRRYSELASIEREAGLSFMREPDLGFALAAHRWASGHRLESVLRDVDLQPGDFVRWTRQLIDLLGQVADAADVTGERDLSRTARAAVDSLRRGVVAHTSVA